MAHPAIAKAIETVGLTGLARSIGVSYQAIRKWERAGRLPRTEWTGETTHAEAIERATDGYVSVGELMVRYDK